MTVNLRAERRAVNSPFVVQGNGSAVLAMVGGNIVRAANDAGFQHFTISDCGDEIILRNFLDALSTCQAQEMQRAFIRQSSVKHDTQANGRCSADKSVRATRPSRYTSDLAGGFFFFFGVAGEETFDEAGIGFAGAEFGVV